MAIENAAQASEVVRGFLADMGQTLYVWPRKAERSDGTWVVEFGVGYLVMRFEINAETGEIIRYGPVQA